MRILKNFVQNILQVQKVRSLGVCLLTLLLTSVSALAEAKPLDRVDNLTAANIGMESINIEFDEVTDATEYLVFYGTESVIEASQKYAFGPLKSDTNSFEITELDANTEYFITVIASDGLNFSSHFANELAVTTLNTDANVGATPFVKNSSTPAKNEILLSFSTEVELTNLKSTSLSLQKIFDNQLLTIKSIESVDASTLKILTAEELEAGVEYLLNIKTELADLEGNVMLEKDRAITIVASAELEGAVETGLKIDGINTLNPKQLEVVMNLDVTVTGDLKDKIAVIETENPDVILDVELIEANKIDKNRFLLVLNGELDDQKSYSLIITDLTSDTQIGIAEADSVFSFNTNFNQEVPSDAKPTDEDNFATSEPEADPDGNNPPSEVSQLSATASDLEASSASVKYKKASDPDGDLKAHNIYLKGSNSDYKLNTSVDKNTESATVKLGDISAAEGLLKVTAIDEKGNETTGRVTPIRIPGVGPAGVAWLFLGSIGLVALNRKEDII